MIQSDRCLEYGTRFVLVFDFISVTESINHRCSLETDEGRCDDISLENDISLPLTIRWTINQTHMSKYGVVPVDPT